MNLDRRTLLKLSAATATLGMAGLPARAQALDELVIAYNVTLPSWDPTVGPSAVNPTIQGLYQSVFDQFILQQPDLSPAPGLLTEWGWNEDKTRVRLTVRDGMTWHDGSPFTAEDVAWSISRVANPETGSPIQFVWGTLANHRVEGNRVIADVVQFDPTIFKWMYFLTGYVLPRAYYEKVGPEGFEAAPIGTGPSMVDKFERNAFVRLKANANYRGGKPDFETVTITFVTDAAARVAEVESGNSHVTLEMPDEEFDRLKASGYGPDNPVKFKIQTTKGFKPKDYEMVQAIVGIEAEIEVYEIAKHYELRAADQLAPAAFHNWGNSVGDPTTSTGFAMFGPSPHSVWDGEDLTGMIGPL